MTDCPTINKVKTIIFVVNVDWFFRSHRLSLALEAVRRGWDVHLITDVTQPCEDLEEHGISVHHLSLGRSSLNPLSLLLSVIQLSRIINKIKPEIIHTVALRSVLVGGLAAKLCGNISLVVAISGLGFVFSSETWKAKFLRPFFVVFFSFLFKGDHVRGIFQNSNDIAVLKSFLNLPDSRVRLIRGSGVDLDRYHPSPLPEGVPVVLMASRLIEDKGVRDFVTAARIVAERGFQAYFQLVGQIDPGNPTSIKKAEIVDWRRDGVVEVMGHRQDMELLLPKAHLVVLPSYYGEGLPKILVEAAACGRAVVTTDWPGCRDAIIPGQTGVLVPPRDVDALVDTIIKLLSNRETLTSMGRRGRILAEDKYSIDKIVIDHFTVYDELVTG